MTSHVWPFIPFVALRGAQIFFALIVLGLSAHIGSVFTGYYGYDGDGTGVWSAWFSMVTALFTLIGCAFLLVAFFIMPHLATPMICLAVDAFLFLFWLISLAGFANQFQVVLGNYCNLNICSQIKGDMAMIVFEFLLFLGTLIFSALWFHRERSGKVAPANPEAGSVGAIGGSAPVGHGSYPMQQGTPAPAHHQQYQQYPQQPYPPAAPEGQYNPQHTGPVNYQPTA